MRATHSICQTRQFSNAKKSPSFKQISSLTLTLCTLTLAGCGGSDDNNNGNTPTFASNSKNLFNSEAKFEVTGYYGQSCDSFDIDALDEENSFFFNDFGMYQDSRGDYYIYQLDDERNEIEVFIDEDSIQSIALFDDQYQVRFLVNDPDCALQFELTVEPLETVDPVYLPTLEIVESLNRNTIYDISSSGRASINCKVDPIPFDKIEENSSEFIVDYTLTYISNDTYELGEASNPSNSERFTLESEFIRFAESWDGYIAAEYDFESEDCGSYYWSFDLSEL